MNTQIYLFFYFIQLLHCQTLQFSNSLQRFVYNQPKDTIILASVNHIYSLNATDLTILSDIDLSISKTNHHCLKTNQTSSHRNLFYFSATSYLNPVSNEQIFNQLLLLTNDSVLICSTATRGSSCELRSLTDLHLIRNSSQHLVSSSPFSPSIGFVGKTNQILYLSNTYDSQCDPFYAIPTLSGRSLSNEDFLSILNFQSGQSALQQSTYTLRLSNTRLIKDFFLYYLYAFEYKHFSYFLTIQQADTHHFHKHKLQTKIVRFCQTLKQPIIKSYVEIPLTCGENYHYLITAKFSPEKQTLYGLFRNTTLANFTSTSHAICAYSIKTIQDSFYQTIKRCLVDGKGYRGLGFLSPDTHCVASFNEISEDYCPDENETFFQYPIGGHRAIEQKQPIREFHERVNFTSMEIGGYRDELILFVGDDHGTVHTVIQNSNTKETSKQEFPSKVILDLKLIHQFPTIQNAELLILTNDQIIKQNLSTCEQYSTCHQCSIQPLCHWCSKAKKCSSTFECLSENPHRNRLHMCTNIEQVLPEMLSSNALNTELQILLNKPIETKTEEYMCRFRVDNHPDFYQTNIRFDGKMIKCFPPLLNNLSRPIESFLLTIYHRQTNVSFGDYRLKLVNCSSFHSCFSCTNYSQFCGWNHPNRTCLFQSNGLSTLLLDSHQCPRMYLQEPVNHLNYNIDKTFVVRIEQCNQSIEIESCRLYDNRKRVTINAFNPQMSYSTVEKDFCLLKCPFQWSNPLQISFHRPVNLHLSLQFSNQTISIIPHTHISLYSCTHLASNCTSCLQLNPSYGCTWCQNQCMFRNQSMKCLPNHQECLTPVIERIEPLSLPMAGGSLVTIQGKHFDLFQLAVHIADVPCLLIEGESSENRIVCQSGNADSAVRTGFVDLKFGLYGPRIQSRERIVYTNPLINSIEPLFGIQNGGTVLTILGENFTIGNSHLAIFIGNRLCQLISISMRKIECKTRTFPALMINENQSMKLIFDRQTELIYSQPFTILPNPVLHSFDRSHPLKSFVSGGHPLIIHGENFDRIQSIQLQFHQSLFVSPRFRNQTHLIFLTPSIELFNLRHQKEISIRIFLDHFNQTSRLIFVNDPIIYELEPLVQTYTNDLTIQGKNLTAIGHGKNDILVYIGCDLCSIVDLQSDRIVCQPPATRPKRYSKNKHLCYQSEHPSILVSIDEIHSHVGFLIYPKRLIYLGMITGCLSALLVIILIILLVLCRQTRSTPRILHSPKINKVHSLLPVRSYVDYLQMCFASNQIFPEPALPFRNPDCIQQFKYLLESNVPLMDCLFEYSISKKNKKMLTNLLLTQRYNLKNLLKYQNDWISFNICLLTSYDFFQNNPTHSFLSQLYSQLKNKVTSGPVDAIEPTKSFYSLNSNALIHDSSIEYKTIQLLVYIDLNKKFSSNDLIIHLTCLTCDTISQIKRKLLSKLNFDNQLSVDQCELYLLNNSSCSSSSSTASSSVPLVRKSLLTQVLSNQTTKYSTTIINHDLYRDSNQHLLLNDIDHTNELMSQAKKLNTLQHYGIISDGYEMKLIVPEYDSFQIPQPCISCHYCSLSTFHYLPNSSSKDTNSNDYIHLLNHTYEEIGNFTDTHRLFETKSSISSILIPLIENLFTHLLDSDIYLSELIREDEQISHHFYAHLIPFLLRNFHCLFEISLDQSLISSLDILGMIFQIACAKDNPTNGCSLCQELFANEKYQVNKQNCLLIFAEEIQRVRLLDSNLERCLSAEYSSTNFGIEKIYELDDSILIESMEFLSVHANEIVEYLDQNPSLEKTNLSIFLNLLQMYRSTDRT